MSEQPGTYVLRLELPEAATVEVGALGRRQFDAGWYAYVGSAFGPGGLGRVDRHRELARGDRTTRHWHVDHLLAHDAVRFREPVLLPGADVECGIARRLEGTVARFGASDCDCAGHLAAAGSRTGLDQQLDAALDALGVEPAG